MTFNMITMSILKNFHINKNLRLGVFLNIFTIIILIWICHPHNDVVNNYFYKYMYFHFVISLYSHIIIIYINLNYIIYLCSVYVWKNHRKYKKMGSSLNICFQRYLSEYVGETDMDKRGLYNNSPYDLENKGTSNYDDNVSIYGNMKNRYSKKLKIYKTAYKHRYAKKKGLSKLDCYCEHSIFCKIDKLGQLAKNMKNDNRNIKKIVLKNFRSGIIFVCLYSLIGLTVASLCILVNWEIIKINELGLSEDGGITICSFIITLGLIILLVIIYIMMKIVKYEKIKADKGEMGPKEYFYFCKELFRNK